MTRCVHRLRLREKFIVLEEGFKMKYFTKTLAAFLVILPALVTQSKANERYDLSSYRLDFTSYFYSASDAIHMFGTDALSGKPGYGGNSIPPENVQQAICEGKIRSVRIQSCEADGGGHGRDIMIQIEVSNGPNVTRFIRNDIPVTKDDFELHKLARGPSASMTRILLDLHERYHRFEETDRLFFENRAPLYLYPARPGHKTHEAFFQVSDIANLIKGNEQEPVSLDDVIKKLFKE
jgi:hypothetical protein